MELGAAIIQVLWVKVLFGHFLRPQYYNYRVLILDPSRYQIWLVCVLVHFNSNEPIAKPSVIIYTNRGPITNLIEYVINQSTTHYQTFKANSTQITGPLPKQITGQLPYYQWSSFYPITHQSRASVCQCVGFWIFGRKKSNVLPRTLLSFFKKYIYIYRNMTLFFSIGKYNLYIYI